MGFYEELSDVYDIVFPMDYETFYFLSEEIEKGDKVLDLACGTGSYSIPLGEMGFEVDGFDLDDAMICKAMEKNKNDRVKFFVEDMTKISKGENGNKAYNLAFCIGNSLVHLQSKEKIYQLIKNVYDLLTDEGIIVIQIINYDRIINNAINNNNITTLPTIEREDLAVRFVRNYVYKEQESAVDFNTELSVTRNNRENIYKNSISLITLLSEELVIMLKNAGFKNIELFGDFSKEEYTAEKSFATVVRGRKSI